MSETTTEMADSSAKTCEERIYGTADDMMAACCVEKEVDMEFYKKYNAPEGGVYLQSDCGCRTRCRCDCYDCAVASMVRHRSI